MISVRSGLLRRLCLSLIAFGFVGALAAQTPAPDTPLKYTDDEAALVLARRYLQGGDAARPAVLEALDRMGWSVRNHQGAIVHAAPTGTETGLALRDYELEELLWKPTEQSAVRLISVAQALAIPFQDTDPEELAQSLIESIRQSAESTNPQRRFWARFIVALGQAGPGGYDLLQSAPPAVIQPSAAQIKELQKKAQTDPFAMIQAMQPQPVWPDNDPVLAASPLPAGAQSSQGSAARDQQRLEALNDEIQSVTADYSNPDPKRQKAAQERMAQLSAEMTAITQRITAASMQQVASSMKKLKKTQDDENEESEDENDHDGSRFMAEWRDQPLSLLQVSLISRVLAADLRLAASGKWTRTGHASVTPRPWTIPSLPLAALGMRVAQAGSAPSFGDQFAGAAGDIWATVTGAYTGAVLDHHLPDSKFSKAAGIANVIIAWYKTIMTVARQNITIEVENAPLIRTKTRQAGQQRTARAKVEIDFPKSDVLKAIRAAGNLTTIDLQLPDGGPVSGAKVVWRLPEGSYNGKYQTAKGGSEYRPDLAVVQFAQGAGYTSTTNDAGEATIAIEGTPQRKDLSKTVREYPRRAAVAVEVTVKVGNITQDFNDAINTAMGGPIGGGLSFIADMVLRTSFFFQKSKVFPVTDWKEPAWEGEFTITVKGSGSKKQKGEKGGPEQEFTWSMDRYMEGRLLTPDWEEENENARPDNDGRHKLEVNGDSRYFRLNDSSSSRSRNSYNRYEASGPLQIQPPGQNQLALYSRSEPSGSAELMFNGGKMTLQLNPFFGAQCLVTRSEQSGSRSSSKSGPQYLSLLDGVSPSDFTIIEDNDGSGDTVEGSKTFDYAQGSLPFVPSFKIEVTVKYRLWKNNPPPPNKPR